MPILVCHTPPLVSLMSDHETVCVVHMTRPVQPAAGQQCKKAVYMMMDHWMTWHWLGTEINRNSIVETKIPRITHYSRL